MDINALYAHGLLGSSKKLSSWVRPSDWPAMPTPATQEIDILSAVWNNGSNYCALAVTVSSGTVTIDWGDGTAPQTYTSGATAQYQYSYSASGLGALTAEGYKTAIVKITPTAGGATISSFSLGKRHSAISVSASNPWLDLQVNAPSCTSMQVHDSGANSEYLQRCNMLAIGAVTSLAACFYNCYALQSVTWPVGSLSAVTGLGSCFLNCYALQSVTWPVGSLSAVTDLGSCFLNCSALQSVTWPVGSLGAVTTVASSFNSCPSLADIENCAIPVTFSVANCNLSAANLNAIYTALPVVVSQTITVTGNVGDGTDTQSIATTKGWTVTA